MGFRTAVRLVLLFQSIILAVKGIRLTAVVYAIGAHGPYAHEIHGKKFDLDIFECQTLENLHEKVKEKINASLIQQRDYKCGIVTLFDSQMHRKKTIPKNGDTIKEYFRIGTRTESRTVNASRAG